MAKLCVYFGGLSEFKLLLNSNKELNSKLQRIRGVWWQTEEGADTNIISKTLTRQGIAHAIKEEKK